MKTTTVLLLALALLPASAIGAVPDLIAVRSGPPLGSFVPPPPAPDDVSFYDPVTGAAVALFPARSNNPSTNDAVIFIAAPPRAIVTGGEDVDSIQVFDLSGPAPVLIAQHGLSMPPADMEATPDGRLVVIRTGFPNNPFVPVPAPDDAVVFLDPATGGILAAFPAASNGATVRGPNLIAISPDGSRAIVTGGAGVDSIQVFDLTGPLPVLLKAHGLTNSPHDVDVIPGTTLPLLAVIRSGPAPPPAPPAAPGPDDIAFVDLVAGNLLKVFPAATDNPRSSNSIAFTPDGSRVAVTGGANPDSVQVFDLTGALPALLKVLDLTHPPGDVDVTPDGRFFVVRSGRADPAAGAVIPDAVAFVSPGTGEFAARFGAASNNADRSSNSIAFTPDGSRAVVTGGATTDSVQVFDTAAAVPVLLAAHGLTTPVDDVHMTSNARFAIVRSGDTTFPDPPAPMADAIAFYDPATAGLVALFPAASSHPWDTHGITVLPDSSRAVVTGGAAADSVQVFDLTGALPARIAAHARTHPAQDVNDSASPPDRHAPDDQLEIDVFKLSVAIIELQGPFGKDRVRLSGAARVNVSIGPEGEAIDPDGDGLDQVLTEMIQLDLTGMSALYGNVHVTLRPFTLPPFRRSLGEIEERANTRAGRLDIPPFAPSGEADSFFDIFFQIEVDGPLGHFLFFNDQKAVARAVIFYKPPKEPYVHDVPIFLVDQNGQPVDIQITEARHLPECEVVPPICQLAKVAGGVDVTIQDPDSGLLNIGIVQQVNATVDVPSFGLGEQGAVVVKARKIDPDAPSRVELAITDVCENVTLCDPVLVLQIREAGKPATETVADLPQAEGKVTVVNGDPGLSSLRITANGRVFMAAGLQRGETRTIDVSSAMLPGNANVIELTALGRPGGSAEVIIHDGSGL